jgi:drug/metabolite transporter (DMT)-like permease
MVQAQTLSVPNRPLVGAAWMLVSGVCFVFVTAGVKHVGQDVPAAQAAFLRYAIGLVFLLPLVPAMLKVRLDVEAWGMFGLRGILHSIGAALWFFAMTQISIAEVTAMNYLSPIYIAIGAAMFLGEKLALRRIAAILGALIGALIILRPGFREISPGHIAMLGTAVLFAMSYLIAKRMSRDVDATVIVALLSLMVAIGLAPMAILVWVTPTFEQLAWLTLVALVATAAHFAMTYAFAAAPITVTQPVTFLQLVWATLLGVFVFSEPADSFVILGGVIIMASISFISWREAVLRRRDVTPPADATKL